MSEPVKISTIRPPSMQPVSTAAMMHGDPCTLVIFGAAGDLSRRKLLPAIYQIAKKKLLAADFRIIGVGMESLDDASFRTMMHDALVKADDVKDFDETVWAGLEDHLYWVSGNLTENAVYTALAGRLAEFEAPLPEEKRNRLMYLAVPPSIFATIVTHLAESKVAPRIADVTTRPWRRVILEKPFGTSLPTAQALNKVVLDTFSEHQVYRIDHYVGKETVQNVLVFRSANSIFEALWHREHIAHVQITAAETVGLEGRGGYYEHAGVVRDMFQNHLLQLLALTAMDPPVAPTADAIRDEKVRVLRAIKPLVENGETSAVRAQYTAGEIGARGCIGYREEPGVDAASKTPTYAAMRIMVDTDRWRGVPFYLRSGKHLKKRVSEVAIQFKLPQKLMYEPHVDDKLVPNVLVLRIQPDDGVSLGFEVKIPGAAMALTPGIEITPVEMNFSYTDAFGSEVHPAYETLLLDCMIGDATLFTRSDEVEAAWRVIDPLL
ncbi:MAG: glucose-6-phosphate dehydrogenase, partial [Polyangiaceae bacterium]